MIYFCELICGNRTKIKYNLINHFFVFLHEKKVACVAYSCFALQNYCIDNDKYGACYFSVEFFLTSLLSFPAWAHN